MNGLVTVYDEANDDSERRFRRISALAEAHEDGATDGATALVGLHRELVDVLDDINMNLARLVDALEDR